MNSLETLNPNSDYEGRSLTIAKTILYLGVEAYINVHIHDDDDDDNDNMLRNTGTGSMQYIFN